MPRKSPHIIILTQREKKVLEPAARKYTSQYKDMIRAKIVLMASQGLDNDEIADRLDTPRQIVSKWRKRFHEEGIHGLQDLLRGGRPGSSSPCGDS